MSNQWLITLCIKQKCQYDSNKKKSDNSQFFLKLHCHLKELISKEFPQIAIFKEVLQIATFIHINRTKSDMFHG